MEAENQPNEQTNGSPAYEQAIKLKEYHDWIFKAIDGKPSVRETIDQAAIDLAELKRTYKEITEPLDNYKKQLLGETPEGASTKKEIDKLLADINNRLASTTELEKQVQALHDKAFKGSGTDLAYEAQFQNSVKQIGIDLKEGQEQLRVLKAFYDKVVDTQGSDGKKVPGLDSQVGQLKAQLQVLIKDASSKLYALTDSALHNAFASRANDYTKEFAKLQNLTLYCVIALIVDMVFFGVAQLILVGVGKDFNYHALIYQFSIAGALIFVIWMFNRNQKIAKKLAEEYHHKASLAEAMTGYRALYGLDHDDEEYLQLFNSIKDQLNSNPSKQIDTFLNLKSPHEEISGAVSGLLDPKNLEVLADKLKPLLDKK